MDTQVSVLTSHVPAAAQGDREAFAALVDHTRSLVCSLALSIVRDAELSRDVAQDVFVSAESPVVDPKRTTVQTNVSLTELQEIPSSRDPWVVLQTVPGIIVDRVNVGGAESGQQSNYQAKGAPGGDNTWNIDGVPITDMSALGSSPTYYDFDMFQEMQVTTGGASLTNPTPGVALNFVLKSGSNTPHGSARIYYENEDMQSTNMPDDLIAALGGTTGKGNRIDEYQDHGFELGVDR